MPTNVQNHCVDFSNDICHDGSVLAVSNIAGGGHVEATKAIRAQFLDQQQAYHSINPTLSGEFKVIDIFHNSLPPLINDLFAYSMAYPWNKAKRNGDIKAQERLFNGRIMGIANTTLIDWLLFVPVFLSTFFRLLFDRKIRHIVITQPIAISGIFKASRLINRIFGRRVNLSIVLTDLPTEGATHYSRPIKNLSDNDKKLVKVITTKPLILDPNDTEKHWWKRVFGLRYAPEIEGKSQVLYREFPLRPAFIKYRDNPPDDRPSKLDVTVNNSEEERFVKKLLSDQSIKFRETDQGKELFSIDVDPNKELVGFFTIGSQAARKTKDYVIEFIENVKHCPSGRTYTLFVACGKHKPAKETLFRAIYDACAKARLPKNIRIIPMGYQDDQELAPLLHRADFVVGSAGGLTSFELLRTAKGKVFLHSEADGACRPLKDKEFEAVYLDEKQKQLLQGFAMWEKWTALYLLLKINATIITPKDFWKNIAQLPTPP